ncbi:MAG: PH domain-containing protein, partial [Zymomonas mobilis subsp. pomaceae]
FYYLPKILADDEVPMAIASGLMKEHTWLIALTNQRLIFLDKGLFFGMDQVALNLSDIVSIHGSTGLLLGNITVSTAGQNYEITNISKAAVTPFTNLINTVKEQHSYSGKNLDYNSQSISSDKIVQLEKLAALKEKGILTEEEFKIQKAQILGM